MKSNLARICDELGIYDIECGDMGEGMGPKDIVLFDGITLSSDSDSKRAKECLKKYCIVDSFGSAIYVKKPGNDHTTYAIDFLFDVVDYVRKIQDRDGNNIDESIYDSDESGMADFDGTDNPDDLNYFAR